MVGELLDRAARQQALLDAWAEIRDDVTDAGRLNREYEKFERDAARQVAGLSDALRRRSWRPSPVRPVELAKPSGGVRRLGVPALEDRIVEKALLRVLDPLVDPELLPWSYAYRRGLGVSDALRVLLDERDDGAAWVARGDFAECFDAVPRARVLERLERVVPDSELLELVRLLVYRPVRGEDGSSAVGLHQGSALSPLLANLYLDGFDRAMLAAGWRVVRYADDFAIPVSDRPAGDAALAAATRAAAGLGLELGPGKCSVRSFEEGVPFLGELLTAGTGSRVTAAAHPGATTVYVNEEGGLLRSRGSRLRLERDGEAVFSVAFPRVRQVVVFGRVGVTTPFLQQVLVRGIDLVLLSDTGRYIGRLQAATAANPFVRRAQFSAERDAALALNLARRIVRGKIVNMRGGLLRGARRSAELRETADGPVGRLGQARQAATEAPSNAAVMGVEGAATKEYFAAFGRLLDPPWSFAARRRRPPPDPVNSLLSLGYTLLVQEAVAAAEVAGLDPHVGFLHQLRVGRPALALDLVEEFRPVLVDAVVLRVLNTGMLRPGDFVTSPGPPVSCLLTREGRRTFLAAYERRMLTLVTHPGSGRRVSYRVALSLQARALADELVAGDRRYEPMVWK